MYLFVVNDLKKIWKNSYSSHDPDFEFHVSEYDYLRSNLFLTHYMNTSTANNNNRDIPSFFRELSFFAGLLIELSDDVDFISDARDL